MIWKMAFRNIWRNKRRTLITAASVMFAGFLTITMSAIETGMWENMLQSVINQSTGQVQVQSKAFFDEPTLDNAFSISKEEILAIKNAKKVDAVNPRIESYSLAAFEDKTKPVYILGVDPIAENTMTALSEKMYQGEYLDTIRQSGIIVGYKLAEKLSLTTGDSLAFFGQGYRGAFSVGILPVRGLVKFPLDEMNSQMVFMNLQDAWDLFQADSLYTQLMVRTKKNADAEFVKQAIKPLINPENLEVYSWKQLIPDLVKAKEMDESTTVITMFILYLVVTFGMFGTLLMMMNERRYEMGVLVSIGMKKHKLMFMVWLEFWIMAILGLFVAMLFAWMITAYLHWFPVPLTGMEDVYQQFGFEAVLTATVNPMIFIKEILKVTVIITLLSIYPILKIRSLNPIAAMRS